MADTGRSLSHKFTYTSRESAQEAPGITDADEPYASVEQMLRGRLARRTPKTLTGDGTPQQIPHDVTGHGHCLIHLSGTAGDTVPYRLLDCVSDSDSGREIVTGSVELDASGEAYIDVGQEVRAADTGWAGAVLRFVPTVTDGEVIDVVIVSQGA